LISDQRETASHENRGESRQHINLTVS
jgi:hypothetical protein